jgi:hypothetical protein
MAHLGWKFFLIRHAVFSAAGKTPLAHHLRQNLDFLLTPLTNPSQYFDEVQPANAPRPGKEAVIGAFGGCRRHRPFLAHSLLMTHE